MLLILDTFSQEVDVVELQLVILELLDLHDLVVAATIKAVDLCSFDIILEMIGSFSLGSDENTLLVLGVGAKWSENTATELAVGHSPGEGGKMSLIVSVPLEVRCAVHHDSEFVNLLLN